MESEGVEESGEVVREESSGQNEDGSDKVTENCTAAITQAQESGSQSQSGPDGDDLISQLHPDHSVADNYSLAATNSVKENVAQASLTLNSNFNTLDDMEDQEPPLEEDKKEDNLIVLDPEHPLVRRHQAALNTLLRKELDRLNQGLKEKREMEKAGANHLQEMKVEIFKTQEQLARLHTRLENLNHTNAQAKDRRQQAQVQLEAMKSKCSSMKIQDTKLKANVSQLQAELDKLMLQLTFTQGDSEALHCNVKAMKNFRSKVGAEKHQAKDQKLKQDLYLERLTKDAERLRQEIAMYEAQTSAQAEKTKAVKEALSEAEMEMESIMMVRKQLLQQWSSSLVAMRRKDEAFSSIQEALRAAEHEGILLDKEIEGLKRSTIEEQEKNETLTMQLKKFQVDCATSKKLISQRQAQRKALQTHYSTCFRTLRETEYTLARLSKEANTHQAEVNHQRRQLEKERAKRLELEDKITTHIQQKLIHSKTVKYSQQLSSRIAILKKEKSSQLWKLENDLVAVRLESSEVSQHLDSLTLTQEALDKEIANYNKLLTSNQTKISSLVSLMGQKQVTIANYNKKISEIAARTGHDDLSPLQIKIEALMDQIKELEVNIKSDQQLWMKRQATLVGLTQEIEANNKDMLKLQTEYTAMQQRKLCLESQIEAEHREQTELDKNTKMLRGDLVKLKAMLRENGQLSQALEKENALMETDFRHRLKEAEREAIEMQMKYEKTQEEKERLLKRLVEADQQIALWEKKTQSMKVTIVKSEESQRDIKMMKAEIHRKELRLNQLMKVQQRLLRDSEATVARRENIIQRQRAMVHSSHKHKTKASLYLATQRLKRKIQNTNKQVLECEQVIRDLQMSQVSLSDRIAQKKQQLIELRGTNSALDLEIEKLQDTKDRNLTYLVALQSRNKKLQAVCEGSYKALSTRETVGAALQSQMERLNAISTVLHRVCEDFPEHRGALRRVMLALAAYTQVLELGKP